MGIEKSKMIEDIAQVNFSQEQISLTNSLGLMESDSNWFIEFRGLFSCGASSVDSNWVDCITSVCIVMTYSKSDGQTKAATVTALYVRLVLI